MNNTMRYGFRIVGNTAQRRRLVNAADAYAAYADCDPRAEVEREAYLSAFTFGDDFRELLKATGSVRGFAGACFAPFLWFDIDRESKLDAALNDARRLASFILQRYRVLDDDALLLFYSGAKGFHCGLPTTWTPTPSTTFHLTARRFAEGLAAAAGVAIDSSVYDRVRAFRAPNSRHPKTGLHKRRLTFAELMGLPVDRIRDMARDPNPFEIPAAAMMDEQAASDWQQCERLIASEAEAKAQRRAAAVNGTPTLNRQTLAVIRDGADEGDRHRLIFSAAANLAEFGCPPALAHALLTPAALDSGLPPREAHRQIECGLNHARQTENNNHA